MLSLLYIWMKHCTTLPIPILSMKALLGLVSFSATIKWRKTWVNHKTGNFVRKSGIIQGERKRRSTQ